MHRRARQMFRSHCRGDRCTRRGPMVRIHPEYRPQLFIRIGLAVIYIIISVLRGVNVWKKILADETCYRRVSAVLRRDEIYRPIAMRVIWNNNATLNGQYNNNNLILYCTYIKYYNKIRPLPRGRCVLRPLNHTIAAVEMVIKRARVLIPIFICIKYMYIVHIHTAHST